MSCTANHILIERGVSLREEGRRVMKRLPVDGILPEPMASDVQRINDLEAINAQLLEALKAVVNWPLPTAISLKIRAAIKASESQPTSDGNRGQDQDSSQ